MATTTTLDDDKRSHQKCRTEKGHICHEPSGRPCDVTGCLEPAGTWWGPHWCPVHDAERLDRVTAAFEELFRLDL